MKRYYYYDRINKYIEISISRNAIIIHYAERERFGLWKNLLPSLHSLYNYNIILPTLFYLGIRRGSVDKICTTPHPHADCCVVLLL